MFPNTGNMGLPLALFAFGNEGLALAVVYFACTSTLQFTLGISLASGSMSVSRLLRTPAIYAVVVSLLILTMGWEVPRWVDNTMGILGGLTIPLMLLTLGVSWRSSWRGQRNTVLAAIRFWRILIQPHDRHRVRLARVAAGVLIISSMPVAVPSCSPSNGARMPAMAAMVVISTMLSFVMLPLLVLFVLR
jgi:predicted permease